jgi:Carbon-nitrogen hydrolase
MRGRSADTLGRPKRQAVPLFPHYNKSMTNHGFVRVAAAVPALRVADYAFNVERILGLLARAQDEGVAVLVFPELCLTGYTCADLFHQTVLQEGARDLPRRQPLFDLRRPFFTPPSLHKLEKTLAPVAVSHFLVDS